MAGSSDHRSASITSSFRKTEEKSGALVSCAGGMARPSIQANAVVAKIAARNANGFRRRSSTTAMTIPISRNPARWSSVPRRTMVDGSAAIRPALRKPMNVSSKPIPPAAAMRSPEGMAMATCSRSGVADTTRNRTPAQNTIPSAVCQGT